MVAEDQVRITIIRVISSNTSLQQTSHSAALIFMGFETPEEGDEQEFFERMERWAGGLPRVAFVDSVGEMSLES